MTETPYAETVRIPLQVSQGCIVASIQVDLTEMVLRQFQDDLLQLLHRVDSSGVILDLSGVHVMDVEDFEALLRTGAMVELLGAQFVLCGIKPGVVSAIVDLGAEVDKVKAALDLDEAYRMLGKETVEDEPEELFDGQSVEAKGEEQFRLNDIYTDATPGAGADDTNPDPS